MTASTRARTIASAMAARVGVMALMFASSVVMSRAIGPDGRGYYQVMLTTCAIVVSLGGVSVELALGYLHANRIETPGSLRSLSVYGGLLTGTIIAIVTAAALMIVASPAIPFEPRAGFVLALAAVPTMLTNIWIQRALLIGDRIVAATANSMANAALVFLGTLSFFLASSLTAVTSIALVFAGSVLETALGVILLRPRISDLSLKSWQRALRIGARFHISQIALVLLVRLDIILLSWWSGKTAVGFYAVAISITVPLEVLASTLTSAFLPRQLHRDHEVAVKSAAELLRVSFLIVGCMALVLGVAAPWVVPAVWGPEFTPATSPLLILLPGAIALAVQRPLGTYFVRQGLSRVTNLRAILALAVDLVLCVILIPAWGESGAAAASTIAYLLYAVVSIVAFLRITDAGLRSLLPTASDFQRLLAASRTLSLRTRTP